MRIVVSLILVAAMAAAGCGSSSATGSGANAQPTGVRLALDWYPNPDHVGIYTAISHGDFARAGLDVTPVPPANVSDPLKLIAAGRADIAISYEPELFFAQQSGLPVEAVASVVPTALNSIIARGGQGITTPADLKGHSIGVDGSASTSAYLDAVLHHSGLSPADVTIVNVGFNLVPALLSHRVDAVTGVYRNIEGAQLAAAGAHPVVMPIDQYGVPSYDELVVAVNRSKMQSDASYRRTVGAFVSALRAGTVYAQKHPATALAVMRKVAASDYQKVLERSVPETLRLLHVEPLDERAWARFGAWMYAQKLLSHKPDASGVVGNP